MCCSALMVLDLCKRMLRALADMFGRPSFDRNAWFERTDEFESPISNFRPQKQLTVFKSFIFVCGDQSAICMLELETGRLTRTFHMQNMDGVSGFSVMPGAVLFSLSSASHTTVPGSG